MIAYRILKCWMHQLNVTRDELSLAITHQFHGAHFTMAQDSNTVIICSDYDYSGPMPYNLPFEKVMYTEEKDTSIDKSSIITGRIKEIVEKYKDK